MANSPALYCFVAVWAVAGFLHAGAPRSPHGLALWGYELAPLRQINGQTIPLACSVRKLCPPAIRLRHRPGRILDHDFAAFLSKNALSGVS